MTEVATVSVSLAATFTVYIIPTVLSTPFSLFLEVFLFFFFRRAKCINRLRNGYPLLLQYAGKERKTGVTTCVIRTLIIYILLILSLRATGKRQIGELSISELVSTFLISELAANPISNQEVPLSFAVVPILLIMSLEIVISFSATRLKCCKKIFLGSPSVLIRQGQLQPRELSRARMSLEELLCELRQNNITAVEDVSYAILEMNGKLSVIPKADKAPLTPKDMQLAVTDSGIAHALVVDGEVNRKALDGAGRTERWLDAQIKKACLAPKDIFLLTVDDTGHVYIIKRKDLK